VTTQVQSMQSWYQIFVRLQISDELYGSDRNRSQSISSGLLNNYLFSPRLLPNQVSVSVISEQGTAPLCKSHYGCI